MKRKKHSVLCVLYVIRWERSVNNSNVTVYTVSYTRMTIFKSTTGRLHSSRESNTSHSQKSLNLLCVVSHTSPLPENIDIDIA